MIKCNIYLIILLFLLLSYLIKIDEQLHKYYNFFLG